MVDGKPTSLAELGYNRVGMDDGKSISVCAAVHAPHFPCASGYQACGAGINGSFHDADNNLIINKTLFPDMKSMSESLPSANHKLVLKHCLLQTARRTL